MAESVSAEKGHGFLIVALSAAAALILVYPLLQAIAKIFGLSI